MASPSVEQTVTGTIRSVNERGLKLEGGDAWLNVSKYAVGVVLPERGTTVSLTLDKAGFIRSCEVLEALPMAGASDVLSAAPSTKDRTITRLAILKAAAEFAAARPNLKSGHVLSIAESWERWVNRADDAEQTTYDLTDAF
jgi:hypothetical protein